MSDENAPDPKDARTQSRAASAAQSELALLSPMRSLAAISFTFFLFTQVLSRVALATVSALLPWAFPAQSEEGALVVPEAPGLAAVLVTTFLNAILAGLLAGRIGGAMRRWHGVALGAILGLFAALTMGSLQGFPGWFALGWLLAPAVGASLGGFLSERVGPKVTPRLVSETVSARAGEAGSTLDRRDDS